jgi:hypothetical protein
MRKLLPALACTAVLALMPGVSQAAPLLGAEAATPAAAAAIPTSFCNTHSYTYVSGTMPAVLRASPCGAARRAGASSTSPAMAVGTLPSTPRSR